MFPKSDEDNSGRLMCCGKSFSPPPVVTRWKSSSIRKRWNTSNTNLAFLSLQEGFGYPPLEAMGYQVPVLSSNVCSMPSILSNSALMFSPFYKNDLFMKLKSLKDNYQDYKELAIIRYQAITQKQQSDFELLINMITNI